MSDLSTIPSVKIPRYISSRQAQLFCFTDASAKAYATNVYLGSSVGMCLIFSKSKVAPVKQVTLPRLELVGVLIGIQSLKYVSQHMKIKVEEKILWTDSQVVLNWLKTMKPLSVFVKNRVAQITNGGDISFCYISSQENPADMASRGLEVNNLQHSSLWWHGPVWLCFEKDRWPTWGIPEVNSQILQDIQSEYRTSIVFSTANLVGEGPTRMECLLPLEIGINQFSTLCRLVRVTSWCMRFIGNLKGEQQRGSLTATELDTAKTQWLKHVQAKHFSGNDEKTKNLMRQLNVSIDETGCMRCYGRICNAEVPTSAVNPILLPQDDYFTELIIRDTHTDTLHAGTSQTLSSIRQSYWIPQGRVTVR